MSPLRLKSPPAALRLNAVQACKGSYTENDIKPHCFFRRPVTLFVMELEVVVGSRAAGVNMVWLRWGSFGSVHRRLVSVPA